MYLSIYLSILQMPLMGECLERGYQVVVFCPSSPKYKNMLLQWGLDAVRVVGYGPESPLDWKEAMKSLGVWKVSSLGGPLGAMS
jgi:hypothetical protein